MSPQTETKASVGFKAGVKESKLTYYSPEYETKDFTMTAILERRESESLWGRFCNWITTLPLLSSSLPSSSSSNV
jgi:hypothetical protein